MEAGMADLRKLRKSVVAMALAIAGGMVAAEASTRTMRSRLALTCETIAQNCREEKTENKLPKRSLYYSIIERVNSYINGLSTPSPC